MVVSDVLFETYYLQCIAQASYLIAHDGVAVVVDPRRDVDIYIDDLQKHNLKLKGILLTHVHADFVAGHLELHKRTGAPIMISKEAGASHPQFPVCDGDTFVLSKRFAVQAMATPGHTLGCTTYVLVDRQGDSATATAAGRAFAGRPLRAFTGDTLFVGSVGRPDLLGARGVEPAFLARQLFASLNRLVNELPGDTFVHPAHGAGSPCGKNLSNELFSTIARETASNPALAFLQDEDAFVSFSLDGLPEAPQYFAQCVTKNVEGAGHVATVVDKVPRVSPAHFLDLFRRHAGDSEVVIIDTRSAEDFNKGHVHGALNFPVGQLGGVKLEPGDGNFAIWVGGIINVHATVFLVTPTDKQTESIERLCRVGYENVCALLDATMAEWGTQLGPEQGQLQASERLRLTNDTDSRSRLDALFHDPTVRFLDVRTASEFNCPKKGRVPNATNAPLTSLADLARSFDHSLSYIAYCSEGYRSSIAVSILRASGLRAKDVVGGYDLTLRPLLANH